MSLEKSLSQHFSSILQCVDARHDYTGFVIATVAVRVWCARRASGRTLERQTAQLLIQCAIMTSVTLRAQQYSQEKLRLKKWVFRQLEKQAVTVQTFRGVADCSKLEQRQPGKLGRHTSTAAYGAQPETVTRPNVGDVEPRDVGKDRDPGFAESGRRCTTQRESGRRSTPVERRTRSRSGMMLWTQFWQTGTGEPSRTGPMTAPTQTNHKTSVAVELKCCGPPCRRLQKDPAVQVKTDHQRQ